MKQNPFFEFRVLRFQTDLGIITNLVIVNVRVIFPDKKMIIICKRDVLLSVYLIDKEVFGIIMVENIWVCKRVSFSRYICSFRKPTSTLGD